jgi:2-hydroxychromene-2-carboxylate isomerase
MADVDFFWDPVCPWAWITSRWVTEVSERRGLEVDWRFIALRIVNEDKDYEKDFGPGYEKGHRLGLQLLKVAAAVRASAGAGPVADVYRAFGSRIHVERDAPSLRSTEGVAAILDDLGLPRELAGAAEEASWEEVVRADTTEALDRAGSFLGTPIITFAPPDGPSFFGPVISRAPRGEDALDLWDAVHKVACSPGFAELKRSKRERPQTS